MGAVQTANQPTPESIWAILQENAIGLKELRETQKESARQWEEYKDNQKKEAEDYNRRFGHLNNLFGEVSEYMIAPKLREKFKELGLVFPRANQNTAISDVDNNICLEIDVILENGDKAMLVEVKTKLTTERINGHIERLEKMRKYSDLHGDKRTFLGAVAGVVVTEDARNYALKQGLYLIEPSGDNFSITLPNGKPKEW